MNRAGRSAVPSTATGETILVVEDHEQVRGILHRRLGLSGRQVAEKLGATQPDVRVLHMSGYTDDAVVRRGVLDRKASFIQKPFSSDELDLRIRGLLDSDRSASADRVLTV